MTMIGWLQIALFAAIVGVLTRPLGGYLARVYTDKRTPLQPLIAPVETALYRLAGINPQTEQSWYGYAISFLVFHAAGIIALYGLLRLQSVLPLNPQAMTAVAPDLALNTAVRFVTNTSWQSYGGEATLSYLSQMAGITVQSFLSAASGMAVAVALIRGFATPRGHDRQFLGRSDARRALRATADLRRRRIVSHGRRRAADAGAFGRSHDA